MNLMCYMESILSTIGRFDPGLSNASGIGVVLLLLIGLVGYIVLTEAVFRFLIHWLIGLSLIFFCDARVIRLK